MVVESDLEFHFGSRRDSSRKFDLHHRVIGFVSVVRLNEVNLIRQVAHAGDFEMRDVDRAKTRRLPLVVRIVAPFFGNERGLGLKGIQVQVKRKRLLWLAGKIAVAQSFGCNDHVLCRVEMCVDLVGDHTSRQGFPWCRLGRGNGRGDAACRVTVV